MRSSLIALSGSATSWLQVNFPQGMSTSGASPICNQPIADPSFTPSQELAAGPSPSAWPAGPTTFPSGQEAARANRFPMQAEEAASTTSGTSGLTGSGSSASAVLQSSLASRLIALLEGRGSTLFSLTWKEKVTPAGRRYCLLRASGHPTGGTGSTSVPSHWTMRTVTDQHATWEQLKERQVRAALNGRHIGVLLDMQAQLASWPTPDKSAGDGGRVSSDPTAPYRPSGAKKQFSINDAARLAGWPTVQAANASESANNSKGDLSLVGTARLTGWPTPRASDENNNNNSQDVILRRIADGRATVPEMVQGMLSSWGTPTSRDWKDGDCSHLGLPVKGLVSRQVFGTTSSGSSAPMEKGGQLNPDFVRWLMGYPEGWGNFAGTGTRSSLRRQRRSSAPPQTQSTTPSAFVFFRTGMVCR